MHVYEPAPVCACEYMYMKETKRRKGDKVCVHGYGCVCVCTHGYVCVWGGGGRGGSA